MSAAPIKYQDVVELTRPDGKTDRNDRTPCESHELFIGALVDWVHKPRGGYGYAMRVPAQVVALNLQGDRARIAVETKSGAKVKKYVLDTSLRWRKS